MAAFSSTVKKKSECEQKSSSRSPDHDSPIDLTCYSRRNRSPLNNSSSSEDKFPKLIFQEAEKVELYGLSAPEKTALCPASSLPNDFEKSVRHFTSLKPLTTSESTAVDPCNFRPNLENLELLGRNFGFFNSSAFSEYHIAGQNSAAFNEEAEKVRRDLNESSTVVSKQTAMSSLLLSQLNSNFAKNDVFTVNKLVELLHASANQHQGNPHQTALPERIFTASPTYPFPFSCNTPLVNMITSRLESNIQVNTSVSQPMSLGDCNRRIEPKKKFIKSEPNSAEEQKTSSFFRDLPMMVASEAQRRVFLRPNELTSISNSTSNVLFSNRSSREGTHEDYSRGPPSNGLTLKFHQSPMQPKCTPQTSSSTFVDQDSSISRPISFKPCKLNCRLCGRTYATEGALAKHMKAHDDPTFDNSFKCKICKKSCTTLGALRMHIRTHTLPCECPICGKAFSRTWLLQGHIRTHTGEKPYQCSKCSRAFADRSNLRAHMQTHEVIKRYSCQGCDKTFSRISLLKRHQRHCTPTNITNPAETMPTLSLKTP